MGALKSLTFRNCAWLGDIGPNRPPWCPALDGLTSLTELVFDHCPMLNTLPDAVWPMHPWHAYLFCCHADWLRSAPWCGIYWKLAAVCGRPDQSGQGQHFTRNSGKLSGFMLSCPMA